MAEDITPNGIAALTEGLALGHIYNAEKEILNALQNPVPPPVTGNEVDLVSIAGQAVSVYYGPVYPNTLRVVSSLQDINGFDMSDQLSRSLKVIHAVSPWGQGTTIYRTVLATNTAIQIKGSHGNIFAWNIINRDASAICVRFYNDLATNVIVGTTVSRYTLYVPANSDKNYRSGDLGVYFPAAISMAVVTGTSESGTTAPATLPIIELEYA